MTGPNAQDLAERLGALFLPNDQVRELFIVLLRELARGRPVAPSALAASLDWPLQQVRRVLDQVSSIEVDEGGNVVGAGLTLRETPHVFEVDGRRLYAWCALDTLMFPVLLEKAARVSSSCAQTDTPIRLSVTPEAVLDVDPRGTVVSLVLPEASCDVRTAFCVHSNFFASAAAARPWLEEHAGGAVVPVADLFDIGREVARSQFPVVRPA